MFLVKHACFMSIELLSQKCLVLESSFARYLVQNKLFFSSIFDYHRKPLSIIAKKKNQSEKIRHCVEYNNNSISAAATRNRTKN